MWFLGEIRIKLTKNLFFSSYTALKTLTNPLTFCIEAVHHGLENIKLVADGEVDKVGVHQNKEWRTKLSVVLKE